jgi:16S rRNA (cytosine1402-N4)-methyltransferase
VRRARPAPVATAEELAALVERVRPRTRASPSDAPATRVFQALRIAVNEELEALQDGSPPRSTCSGPAAASSS